MQKRAVLHRQAADVERWLKDVFMRDLKAIRKSDANRQAVKILSRNVF